MKKRKIGIKHIQIKNAQKEMEQNPEVNLVLKIALISQRSERSRQCFIYNPNQTNFFKV